MFTRYYIHSDICSSTPHHSVLLIIGETVDAPVCPSKNIASRLGRFMTIGTRHYRWMNKSISPKTIRELPYPSPVRNIYEIVIVRLFKSRKLFTFQLVTYVSKPHNLINHQSKSNQNHSFDSINYIGFVFYLFAELLK